MSDREPMTELGPFSDSDADATPGRPHCASSGGRDCSGCPPSAPTAGPM